MMFEVIRHFDHCSYVDVHIEMPVVFINNG